MNNSFVERDYPEEGQSKKIRAAPYLRISNKEKEGGQSIEIQHERIKEVAEERRWELLEPYIDDGYSGELLRRPGIDRLLDEIEKERIEVVPITEPDRLARGVSTSRSFSRRKSRREAPWLSIFRCPLPETRTNSSDMMFGEWLVAGSDRRLSGEPCGGNSKRQD